MSTAGIEEFGIGSERFTQLDFKVADAKRSTRPPSGPANSSSDHTPITEHDEEETQSILDEHAPEEDFHGHSNKDAGQEGEYEENLQVQSQIDNRLARSSQPSHVLDVQLHRTGSTSAYGLGFGQVQGQTEPQTDLSDYTYQAPNDCLNNLLNIPPDIFEESSGEGWADLYNLIHRGDVSQCMQGSSQNSQVNQQSQHQHEVSQGQESFNLNEGNFTGEQNGCPDLRQPELHDPDCLDSFFNAGQQFDDIYDNNDDPHQEDYAPAGQPCDELYHHDDALQQATQSSGNQTYHGDPQPATYFSGSQPCDDLHQENAPQPGFYLPRNQLHPGHHSEQVHQQATHPQASRQQHHELYHDENNFQHVSDTSKSRQHAGVYQKQGQSHSPTRHQPQNYSASSQQQDLQQEAFDLENHPVNGDYSEHDALNLDNADDDNGIIVEEVHAAAPALDIDEQIEDIKRQVMLVQATAQETLFKATSHEKSIQQMEDKLKKMEDNLKKKRKRSDKADEAEDFPAKKPKTTAPAYRRPSTQKEPKVKAAKGTKRSRAAENDEFIPYVPEDQTRNATSSTRTGYFQPSGRQYNKPARQAQNIYQPNTPSHASAAGPQFNQAGRQVQDSYQQHAPVKPRTFGNQLYQTAPHVTHARTSYLPAAPRHAQPYAHEIEAFRNQRNQQTYPSANYG